MGKIVRESSLAIPSASSNMFESSGMKEDDLLLPELLDNVKPNHSVSNKLAIEGEYLGNPYNNIKDEFGGAEEARGLNLTKVSVFLTSQKFDFKKGWKVGGAAACEEKACSPKAKAFLKK